MARLLKRVDRGAAKRRFLVRANLQIAPERIGENLKRSRRLQDAAGDDDFFCLADRVFQLGENRCQPVKGGGGRSMQKIGGGGGLGEAMDDAIEMFGPGRRAFAHPKWQDRQASRWRFRPAQDPFEDAFIVRQAQLAQTPGAQIAGIADRPAEERAFWSTTKRKRPKGNGAGLEGMERTAALVSTLIATIPLVEAPEPRLLAAPSPIAG
jgi:hypothetical protein